MEQVKRYRLLKDTPDHKAGTIFEYDFVRHTYKTPMEVINGADPYSCYMAKFVENNPKWFAPIPDTPAVHTERNEVTMHEFGTDESYHKKGHGYYEFETSIEVTQYKFPAIKQAIEQIINDEVTETKNYIGTDYFAKDGTRLCRWSSYEALFDQLQQALKRIHEMEGDKEQLIFKDNNDNPIYDQQIYYWTMEPEFIIKESKAYPNCLVGDKERIKYFSTKEAANQYVILNKPCLSLQEVVNHSVESGKRDLPTDNPHYIRLQELIKEKLKQ